MEDYEFLERLEREGISFEIIPKNVTVSARKYDRNSYLKVQLTNLKAMRMYRRGVDPHEIRKYYCKSLRGKYENEVFHESN